MTRLAKGFGLAATLCLWTASAAAKEVTVPVDVSVGPAAWLITGPVMADQSLHTGLAFDVYGVIDQQTLKDNRNRIPSRYRDAVTRLGEVRYNPYIWIPDGFFISPKRENTGMYGLYWRPWSLGVNLASSSPIRVSVNSGLLATIAFIHSETLPSPTLFLRPGIDLKLDVEVPVTRSFLFSFGWSSQFYVPQQVGGFGTGPLEESIFHMGQAFFKIHIRRPYTTNI